MKKKVILIVSAMMLFGLAIAVLALNTSTTSTNAAASCCKGDSCPMKGKANHENCDCAKDGDASCPMMKKDGAMADHQMKMDGKESCPMMNKEGKEGAAADHPMKMDGKESCPMMKGDADHKMGMNMNMDKKHEMKMDGKGHSCACCSHAKEKKDGPSI